MFVLVVDTTSIVHFLCGTFPVISTRLHFREIKLLFWVYGAYKYIYSIQIYGLELEHIR